MDVPYSKYMLLKCVPIYILYISFGDQKFKQTLNVFWSSLQFFLNDPQIRHD